MKTYVPNYYKEFSCIADRCTHSCCMGWEIDIDEDSLNKYKAMEGPLGDALRANISEEETPHFILQPGDRCPFLLESGLCRLILAQGEDILCQICTDHPRFRNFWTDRIEVGLGMACEEAARVILSSPEPFTLELWEDDGTENAQPEAEAAEPADEDALPEDEAWLMDLRSRLLSEIKETGPLARLREYLIFRHIADALYDDMVEERIAFTDYAFRRITDDWDGTDLSDLAERARAFSEEIEYNPEKQKEIMEKLW